MNLLRKSFNITKSNDFYITGRGTKVKLNLAETKLSASINLDYRSNTYGLFSKMLCRLVEILSSHDPDIGMMTQDEQALLGGEHNPSRNKRSVFTSQRILFFEVYKLSPAFNLSGKSVNFVVNIQVVCKSAPV